jgi:VCBS repeat-containing protein
MATNKTPVITLEGDLDALVANINSNNVSVLIGNGAGGFTAATPVGAGSGPYCVALGDVDGDGDLDALVANSSSNTVRVLLGNGAGGFTAAATVGVGSFPDSVALGDVNGDGDLDALVANNGSNNVSVLLGNGAGGFTAAAPVGVGTRPYSVALGDVDGDGHLDALVSNAGSSNNVSVLLGDGAGGFTAAAPVGVGSSPFFLAVGDVNNAQITDEDTGFVFSAVNGNALTLSDADGGDETLTLAAQNGSLTLATQAGLTGVSGDGTHAVTFTGTSAEINAALNGLSYAPDGNFNGRDTLTITANDNADAAAGGPLTATKRVPIIVNSVNEPADLSADVRNLTETNAAADISSSGTLTISDADSPATFVAQAGTVGLYGTFDITSGGAWTYTASSAHDEFVAGTTYTDTFSVASADGTSTSVTINILGSNDPAVLSADVRNLTEGNAAAAISSFGTLTISDPDSATAFVAQGGTAGSYGTFAITSAGAWTYTATSAHKEFVPGTTYTDAFAVASADGTLTSVTINIHGTGDAGAPDFGSDGKSDILWQSSNGTVAAWLMDGTGSTVVGPLGPSNPGPSWHIEATGDFNGDGKSDLLWQGDDGTAAMWLMDGTNTSFVGAVGPFNPGPSWHIEGTGDFNGDGKSDILWQHDNGLAALWLMDGTNVTAVGAVGPYAGPNWHIKATGDFNSDGKADILWQGQDGTPALWLMDGTTATPVGAIGPFNPGPSWEIKGTGDFNGDGKSDIVWQGRDGTPAIWLMDDTDVTFAGAIGSFNPGASWEIEGTADFNGDGKSDILWQNSDGTPAIWLMDGSNVLSTGAAGSFNPGSDWHVIT